MNINIFHFNVYRAPYIHFFRKVTIKLNIT